MNQALAARAEVLKLARLLRRAPDELAYLEQLPADQLRQLREQVTEALWGAQAAAMTRLAAASRVLPVRVVAVIGERAFGPFLSARITGLLDPGRAVEMAATMPVEFLADIAVELDPRRASAVISRIPASQIAAITRELVRRGEYVAMGRFVGCLDDEAVRAAVSEMDDSSLLQVAFVLESKEGLGHLLELLPAERLQRLIEVAGREGLWAEVLGLLSELPPERRAQLAREAESLDDTEVESLVRAAADNDLWQELLPLLTVLSPEAQERIARAAAALEPEHREALAAGVRASGMTEQVAMLEAALRERR